LWIDVTKGLCILGVVALHSLDGATVSRTGLAFFLRPVPVLAFLLGLNFAAAASRRGLSTIRELLFSRWALKRVVRIAAPASAVAALSLALLGPTGLGRNLSELLTGLPPYVVGPGDYFVAVYLQFVILGPLLFVLVKRAGVGLFVAAAILTEACFHLAMTKSSFGIDHYSFYRASMLRYLSVIAVGMAGAVGPPRPVTKASWLRAAPWGAVFLVSAGAYLWQRYGGWVPFGRDWNGENFFTFLYPALGVLWASRTAWFWTGWRAAALRPVALVGRASMHIFLVQIVYFGRGIHAHLVQRLHLDEGLGLIVAFAVLVALGILLYASEVAVRRLASAAALAWGSTKGRGRRTFLPGGSIHQARSRSPKKRHE
jgi:hypothetical protein